MTMGFLCTTEIIAHTSGASAVVTNELKAQAHYFNDVKVVDANMIGCPAYNVPGNPFFIDYMASELVRERGEVFDLAHFNGDPFGRTIEEIKKLSPNAKIVADCPAHELKESIREWMDVYGAYPFSHLTHPYLLKLYTKHLRVADKVLAASRLSKRWIVKQLNKPKEEVQVLRHGTLMPDYKEPTDVFKVGYLGAIGPDKGLKYLFTAWGAFEPKDGMLSIAGKNVDSLIQWKQAVQNSNPDANIELLGFVDNKWDFYDDVSVYVQPSVTEGFGIPVIEAMASGRPVIASKGVGASELIKNGKSGFTFDIRSAEQLHNHIQYFYDNPSEIKRMGKEARKTAKRYTWDKIIKQYIKVYKELLE